MEELKMPTVEEVKGWLKKNKIQKIDSLVAEIDHEIMKEPSTVNVGSARLHDLTKKKDELLRERAILLGEQINQGHPTY